MYISDPVNRFKLFRRRKAVVKDSGPSTPIEAPNEDVCQNYTSYLAPDNKMDLLALGNYIFKNRFRIGMDNHTSQKYGYSVTEVYTLPTCFK